MLEMLSVELFTLINRIPKTNRKTAEARDIILVPYKEVLYQSLCFSPLIEQYYRFMCNV